MLGIGIMIDAWTPDAMLAKSERRRRPRIERHRNGEAMIGLGVLGLAAAFLGRDNWRYSILVVIIGAVFLVVGTVLNAKYVRELLVNRGPLRRREEEHADEAVPNETAVPADREQPIAARQAADTSRTTCDGPERRRAPRGNAGRGPAPRGRSGAPDDSPPA